MRRHGLVDSATGLGLHGHACWAFEDDENLRQSIVDYLTDGVQLGQRLLYVGNKEVNELRADLQALAGVDELVAGGRLQIAPLSAVVDVGARTDADAMLQTYSTLTEQALADGYTGLRVAAEVTQLVADPDNWGDHVQWEAVADRYMARMPLSALCCYDRRALPEQVVADLACVHPAVGGHRSIAPFRLAAGAHGMRLEGEVDYFGIDRLRRVLELSAERSGDGGELDLSGLEFVDHTGVIALAEHVRLTGTKLTQLPYAVKRLGDLLGVAL